MILAFLIFFHLFVTSLNAEQIWIEAESAQLSGFSKDGTSIWVAAAESGEAKFIFNVSSAGSYVVWGRLVVDDSGGKNSFYTVMNNAAKTIWDTPTTTTPKPASAGALVWYKINSRPAGQESDLTHGSALLYSLTSGQNALTILGREAGTKLDKIVITNELDWDPDTPAAYIHIKRVGDRVTFGWEFSSFSFMCVTCDANCQNCVSSGQEYKVTLATTEIPCGKIEWQWPKVKVIGPCSTQEISFEYDFRGIRLSDGLSVFQGKTQQNEVPVDFIFGEAHVRFEVRSVSIKDTARLESGYATSLDSGVVDGVLTPWLVKSTIGDPYSVLLEKQ